MFLFCGKKLKIFQKLTIFLLVFLFILTSSPSLVWAAEEAVSNDLSAGINTGPTPDASVPAPDTSTLVPADNPSEPADTTTPPAESNATSTPVDQTAAQSDQVKSDSESAKQSNNSLLDEEGDPNYGDARKPVGEKINIETDGSTGALIYTFPLTIPPGRNNFQPDLKLIYNNQSNDNSNLFGYGWSVNIPYIERMSKEGVNNLYSENYFNSSLSGELEDISLSDGHHGTYGAKVDNGDFLKYEYSTNNYWLVTDKKGTVYKFGYNAGARQDDPDDSSHAFKWMLEEIRDTNNNYIKYEYYKNSGQIYPSKIKYTGYDTTDGIFEIEFLRESRNDDLQSFKTGFEVSTCYRINEIKAKVSGTWVRKYELAYDTGDNGIRSMLETITEIGQDEQSNTITLPANNFTYQTKTKSWTEDENYTVPDIFTGQSNAVDTGARLADVNGDGLADIIRSQDLYNGNYIKKVYINQGNGIGWSEDTNYTIPVYFVVSNGYDNGARLVDVNGDGLTDIVYSLYCSSTLTDVVYINQGDGTGWEEDTNWSVPVPFTSCGVGSDTGARLSDVNGDGLVDILYSRLNYYEQLEEQVFINKGDGTGWAEDANWTIPEAFLTSGGGDFGVRLFDVNGDGLTDLVRGYYQSNGNIDIKKVYINNGQGWDYDSNWVLPQYFVYNGGSSGLDAADANGDGLTDLLYSWVDYYHNVHSQVFINKGDSTGWQENTNWQIPVPLSFWGSDSGVRLGDINGDGIVDIIRSTYEEREVYIANPHNADLLAEVEQSKGGQITMGYKGTPEYLDISDNLLNPKLPYILQTVSQITYNDGLDNDWTENYEYADGEYYFSDYLNRKLSGFGKVTKTDGAGNVTKTYFHQGNDSDSSHGEYSDDYFKIGKVYRTENYDDSGNLYSKTINKWDDYDLEDDNAFVKLTQTIDSSYDGDTSHKDNTETYSYDNDTGNLTEKITWGEVTGADSGTFTDTGTDKFNANYEYANAANYTSGYPKLETITDQSDNKVKETKYYYDNETFGTVDEGNLTKQEMWVDNANYIDIQKTYNSYGLVTEDIDPRGKTTDYTYDTYNLYPATVTNALDQGTDYEYDYSSGKVTQTTDPNSRVFQTIYDALDRVKQEKQPDLTTPANLVVKTEYTYTDNTVPTKVQQANNLDSSTSFDIYTYLDGFGRKIQERKEAEASNTFSVKDFVYNDVGLIDKESLPYFSAGSARTAMTSENSLYTSYTYDPLQRVLSATNAVGTTANTYDDWELTITDANDKTKDLYKDAYDNLVQVDEHNGENTYTTEYEWNGLANLIKITDSQDNIRNFTYDGLGRRLTAEDLHDPDDEYFGTWTYTYDDAGNLITRLDPKNQTVNWTYDDLNRVLTENYTGQSGTEITYVYDTGTDGIGRLSEAVNADADTTYTYNALGGVKTEAKEINSVEYDTEYAYDRQGNQTLITYPNGAQVKYLYNTAGLLESVQQKQSGEENFSDLISNYDYSPLEQVSYQEDANGVKTYNDYDAAKLYRLQEKITASPDEGGFGDLYGIAMANANTANNANDANGSYEITNQYEYTNSSSVSLPGITDNPAVQAVGNLFKAAFGTAQGALSAPVKPDPVPDKNQKLDFWGKPIDYKLPKDETVYLKYDKTAKPKELPKEAIEFLDKAGSNVKEPELKSYLPKEAIDFYEQEQGQKQESLLLSGDPPDESTNLNSENKWLSENIIYNQGFEDGFDHWGWQNNLDATHEEDCTLAYAGSCSEKVEVNTAGDFWKVQLYQILRLDENVNYKLKFKARSSSIQEIKIEATQHHSPFNNLGLWVTGERVYPWWQEYEYSFTALQTDELAKITFHLGENEDTTYWFDEVEVIPDTFNKIKNPSFENSTTSWGFTSFGGDAGEGTNGLDCIYPQEGRCADYIDMTNAGNYWEVSLYQPTDLDSSKTYVLSFYAWASNGRHAKVALAQNHSPWYDLTPEIDFNVGSSWQKYEVELTPSQTDSNGRLIFYVGEYEPDIYFDNVKLREKQAIKISDSTPEFSAIYDDPDSGDYAQYYQIQVIKYDGTWSSPIWDSGKTEFGTSVLEGDRTEDISYGGDPLRLDGMKYYWRIKLWDDEDNEGPWTNGKDYFIMQGKKIQDIAYTYDNVGNITQIVDESETYTKKIADYTYDDL